MSLAIFDKKIILASKSPRRSQLLSDAGLQFEIRAKEVDESYGDDIPKNEVAEFLAIKKANATKEFLENDDEILLAADSIVLLGEKVMGKPKNASEARSMLSSLSGKEHLVITGVCLLSKQKQHSFSVVSKVYFEDLSKEEIDYYIENFEPFDKAGAYAIQEWIGWCKIKKIEGSYANIMGLPIARVYEELQKF